MERLVSIDQYKELRKKLKKRYTKILSNVYFLSDEIRRFIDLGRIYFIELDDIVFLIFDEEKYYRVCFYAAPDAKGVLPQTDKYCLARDIYMRDKKQDDIWGIEEILKNNGFAFSETVICMQIGTSVIMQKAAKIELFKNMLINAGYSIEFAKVSMLEEIETLLDNTPMIRPYHIDYRTRMEKEKLIEEGGYTVICNPDGVICGVEISTVKNNIGVGEVIVSQDRIAGAASILSLERMKKMEARGVSIVNGWVLENNGPSVKYHTNIGYTLTDRLVDEWIRY